MSLLRRIGAGDAAPPPGGWRGAVQRPPWTDETAIRAACTSCGECLNACPEAILISGPAGTPKLDFNAGACTFCGACAEACDEDVFRPTSGSPWSLVADLGETCLLNSGVTCQSCTDACDERALRFDLRGGRVGQVAVDSANCTGCGACVSFCPTSAISLREPSRQEISA